MANASPLTEPTEGADDRVIPFKVGEAAVRGRIVRLGAAVDDILQRHDFPLPVSNLVGEAAALVAMLGSALKFDGKLILQTQGDGPLSTLVADYSAGGGLRSTAMIRPGAEETAAAAEGAELHYLLRKGHMVMTIDQGPDMERYQGVVPLEGKDLATATVNYFSQSEQIPTAIRLAVGRVQGPDGEERWRAGGIMVQFVPGEGGDRERGEASLMADDDSDAWNRAATLLDTTQADELLDPTLAPERLLYRLFHEDGVRIFDPVTARAECPCSKSRIAQVLAQYDRETLGEMIEDGAIEVSCDFCRTVYRFALDADGQTFKE